MASLTYDGQSFILDGRRLWLVSGAIHYTRTPRALWRARIRAAKQAGLNCIETYVFWNVHEPSPGEFDFEGDRDLRAFVEMIAAEGMFAIVRPGPFVCSEWDFGGFPAWLKRIRDKNGNRAKLREADPQFLEATSRYLTAVMEQIKDLQITTPIPGKAAPQPSGNVPGAPAGGFTGQGAGPILLIQAENEWFSSNDEQHEKYLREVVRYLRENGCEVPIINCNNLWQRMDGTIDCWNGARHMASDVRQLGVVQPEAPRLVTEYWPGWFDQWGEKHSQNVSADLHLYRMAGILSSGGQPNVYMFHGGTNFGFWGGRTVNGPGCFMTTSYDYDAPLLEAGGRGAKYLATKRLATFASQFGHVFAHVQPDHCAAVALSEEDHPLSVVTQKGSQGEVVFLFRSARGGPDVVDIMLPDGLTLPVPMGKQRVAWMVRDVNLGGVAELNYCNLNAWALLDRKMLVVFGPAGAYGLLGIDGAQVPVTVPSGKAAPLVQRVGELTLVVLSEQQVDAAWPVNDGLVIGAAGLDDSGQPIPKAGWSQRLHIGLDGTISKQKQAVARKPSVPRLGAWRWKPLRDMVEGTSDAFANIDGPASLEDLQQDYGYGWYRFTVSPAGKAKVMAPNAGDRVALYGEGKLTAMLGLGPAADNGPVELTLEKSMVALVDNLGRFNYGQYTGHDVKGIADHLYEVKPIRMSKPKIEDGRAPDPFLLTGMVFHRRRGELPNAQALVWNIKPDGKKPMVLEFDGFPQDAMIFVNGEPFALLHHASQIRQFRWMLKPGEQGVTSGNNEIRVALYGPLEKGANPARQIRMWQCNANLTSKGQWAFAPWSVPGDGDFVEMPKSTPVQPAWYRTTFKVASADVPLWLEPRGMSKGQIYLNGHNVGRYWVGTSTGKAVPPQTHYYLPEPWLKTDGDNELLLFDEHGKLPGKCRLSYNAMGPYNK